MRDLIGTLASSSLAQQFITTERPLVESVTFKARKTNTGAVYLGNESTVTTADGFSLDPGDAKITSYDPGKKKATGYWLIASDSNQNCDYWFVLED